MSRSDIHSFLPKDLDKNSDDYTFVADLLYKLYVLQNKINNCVSGQLLAGHSEVWRHTHPEEDALDQGFPVSGAESHTVFTWLFLALTSCVTFAKMEKLSMTQSYLLISIFS
jgi:hypothetical protein